MGVRGMRDVRPATLLIHLGVFAVAGGVLIAGVPNGSGQLSGQQTPGPDPRDFSWDRVDITDVDSDAWVEIPGGTFMMGADIGDSIPNATPAHRVTVPTFRMSRFPITNEQYVAYLRENPDARVPPQLARTDYSRTGPPVLRDSIREGWDRHPVTNVTWHEAMDYVRWLDARVEGDVGLPTEAQWEYAARGEEGRAYPWGDEEPSLERAAFGSRSGPRPSVRRIGPNAGPGWAGYRVPVDSYREGATPEGVYDLAGNVWEWVADCLHRGGYEGAPDDGSEWGGGVCDRQTRDVRMLKGGSWRSNAPLLHAARRYSDPPDTRRGWYGFRVVWHPEGQRQPPSPQGAPQRLYYPKQLTATAPDTFTAHFETTAGLVSIRVYRAWAPHSADRFYNLVANGFYDDTRIYRVLPGFLAQWGLNGNPLVNHYWRFASIPVDPVLQPNTRGRVSFAPSTDGEHTTEVFLNYRDNPSMDHQGHAPFGEVVEGMDVAERFNPGHATGPGPSRSLLARQGNEYLDGEFPRLTRIVRTRVEADGG